MLASRQRAILTPATRAPDECPIRSASGRRPRNPFFDGAPLWSERATDLSEVGLKHSQAAKNLADAGLPDEVALGKSVVSRAKGHGWLPAPGQHVAAAAQRQPGTPTAGEQPSG